VREANEAVLSAAYAIASAADRLTVTQTAEVGSIGVVAMRVDESGADEQAGLAWTYVFAGDRKIDGNEHEPFSDRARAAMQADVDRLQGPVVVLNHLPVIHRKKDYGIAHPASGVSRCAVTPAAPAGRPRR
jgi:hypothetical protein